MITLAAITIITTTPAEAQRRSTSRSAENHKTTSRSNKKELKTKSATKSNRHSTPSRSESKVRSSSASKRSGYATRSQSASRSDSKPRNMERKTTPQRSTNRGVDLKSRNYNNGGRTNSATANRQKMATGNSEARKTYATTRKPATSSSNVRRTTGTRTSDSQRYYHVDKNDKRYTPNRNYKGSKQYWSGNKRSREMNYNYKNKKYYSHYNYHKKAHWDRSWERYRWNHNSWRDYYNGYHPYAYRYHKHYYYHNHYGHVIRRFDYRPSVFVHNHHNYYCYDGHFFRYRRGIGYVLVNMPFGFSFNYLPHEYERVYVNGYLYFRVGNLFFESTNLGFRLVHYPDRYYAYNDDYHNRGYIFDDDYYYEPY